MAPPLQITRHPALERLLQDNFHSLEVPDPRRFYGTLDIQAEVNEIDQHLGMTLGLHIRSHYPKGHKRFLPPEYHGRDDGVKGSLMGFQPIEIAFVEGKGLSPVL